jgi:hypothetical protein
MGQGERERAAAFPVVGRRSYGTGALYARRDGKRPTTLELTVMP